MVSNATSLLTDLRYYFVLKQSRDCLKLGPPAEGEIVQVKWPDGKLYGAKYLGTNVVYMYQVSLINWLEYSCNPFPTPCSLYAFSYSGCTTWKAENQLASCKIVFNVCHTMSLCLSLLWSITKYARQKKMTWLL